MQGKGGNAWVVRREAFFTALCALIVIVLVIHTFSAVGQYRAKAITLRSVDFTLDSVVWDSEARLLQIHLRIANHAPKEVTIEKLGLNLFGNAEFITSKYDTDLQINLSAGTAESYAVERALSQYYAAVLEDLFEEGIDRWVLEGSATLDFESSEPVRINLRLRRDVE